MQVIKLSKYYPIVQKHSRQITLKLKPIENALKKKLLTFYNARIKGSLTPIEILRPRYESTIQNIIFQTIFDSYFAGRKIVLDQIKDKNDFINVSMMPGDVENIEKIVGDQLDQFWKTAGRIKWREIEIQKPELQIEASLIGYSAWVTYHSFNKAVMSKMQDVMTLNQDNPNPNKIAARTNKSIIAEEFRNFAGRVVFTTMHDAKVDPEICAPLDGEIFEADASGTPIPPLR